MSAGQGMFDWDSSYGQAYTQEQVDGKDREIAINWWFKVQRLPYVETAHIGYLLETKDKTKKGK